MAWLPSSSLGRQVWHDGMEISVKSQLRRLEERLKHCGLVISISTSPVLVLTYSQAAA